MKVRLALIVAEILERQALFGVHRFVKHSDGNEMLYEIQNELVENIVQEQMNGLDEILEM